MRTLEMVGMCLLVVELRPDARQSIDSISTPVCRDWRLPSAPIMMSALNCRPSAQTACTP